ncbi:MAG: acyl-CoA/acyl-ACP dehydrogenase [Actinobacteria bacterium]|nr:acyl-CoA/acyl-ACP dehydrogenase [Actinomycetota bacterium]
MDLTWTDEQQALREAVRGFLEERHGPEVVRKLEDDPTGFARPVWDGLAQMDLLGLCLPEEYGGSGMGALELVVLHEELGRALVSAPHLVSNVIAAEMLLAAGSDEQRGAWLPRIATGGAILTVAWHEPQRSDGPEGVALTGKADGDAFRLSGTKIRLPFASSADRIIVLARTGDAPTDIGAFLLDPSGPGVTLTHTTVLSSEAEFQLDLDDVEVAATDLLGDPGAGWAALEAALLDGRIAAAAYAIGGARKALDMQVAYAKERVQFDKPIGSFQGLAHPIADLATELVGAEVLVWQAAWRRDQGEDVAPLIHLAKYEACDVYKRVTKQAQQVYGGIGFTRAIDVQLYTRRAKQLELSWGGPGRMLEAVAAPELDGTPFVGITSAFGGFGAGKDPAIGSVLPPSGLLEHSDTDLL